MMIGGGNSTEANNMYLKLLEKGKKNGALRARVNQNGEFNCPFAITAEGRDGKRARGGDAFSEEQQQ